MNKMQLVEAVAVYLGVPVSHAAEPVDAVLDAIVRSVTAGETVSVTGFGVFEKVDRAARIARNPQTGERVKVKKTSAPRFRPGQGFKDLVSGATKMPKTGPSVKKAPKGSLTGGKSGMAAPAGSPREKAAKKAEAKAKTAAPVKKTPAKKRPTIEEKRAAAAAELAAAKAGAR